MSAQQIRKFLSTLWRTTLITLYEFWSEKMSLFFRRTQIFLEHLCQATVCANYCCCFIFHMACKLLSTFYLTLQMLVDAVNKNFICCVLFASRTCVHSRCHPASNTSCEGKSYNESLAFQRACEKITADKVWTCCSSVFTCKNSFSVEVKHEVVLHILSQKLGNREHT